MGPARCPGRKVSQWTDCHAVTSLSQGQNFSRRSVIDAVVRAKFLAKLRRWDRWLPTLCAPGCPPNVTEARGCQENIVRVGAGSLAQHNIARQVFMALPRRWKYRAALSHRRLHSRR